MRDTSSRWEAKLGLNYQNATQNLSNVDIWLNHYILTMDVNIIKCVMATMSEYFISILMYYSY